MKKKQEYVLDIGCSDNPHTEKGKITVGIDIFEYPLKEAKREGIEMIHCEAEYLPFKNGVFSKIVSRDALGFNEGPNLDKIVDEALRVHKSGDSIMFVDGKKTITKIEEHIRALGYSLHETLDVLYKKQEKQYLRRRNAIFIE